MEQAPPSKPQPSQPLTKRQQFKRDERSNSITIFIFMVFLLFLFMGPQFAYALRHESEMRNHNGTSSAH
jgi:hypothetical protein